MLKAANKLTTPSEQNDEDRSTPEEDGSSARGELKTDIECKEVTSNEETNDDSGWWINEVNNSYNSFTSY